MKTGKITYYIEIPVTVDYSATPAEPMTPTYPGCQPDLSVDFYSYPNEAHIGELMDAEADQIKMACWEDLEENV